jgi:RimJ/RimL family protein N-acetyltransferase
MLCDNCQLPGEGTQIRINGDNKKVCEHCSRLFQENSIYVTTIDKDDLELVLAWRSNPDIYRYFRQQDGPLHWQEHKEWFNSQDNDRYDFIIHYQNRRIGVVSLNRDDEVGILLGDYSARRQGIATQVLHWICNRFKSRLPLKAEIHEENEASQQLFKQRGFEQIDSDDGWLQFVFNG